MVKAGLSTPVVPNADLRAVLWYMIDRKRIADEAEVQVAYIGNCPVPANVVEVAAAIRAAHGSSALAEFDAARAALDRIAAEALGLTDEELEYIATSVSRGPVPVANSAYVGTSGPSCSGVPGQRG